MPIHFRSLAILLLPISALGQTATPPPQGATTKTTKPPSAQVAPAAKPASTETITAATPVITIAGICDKPATAPANCTTVVTREEFERLASVVQPEMAAAGRQRLAALYSQLLVFADAARKQGLNKTPDAQQAIHFAEVQALSQVLARKLQGEVKVSADDVQKYYHDHPKQFEEGSLQRLFVPRGAQAGGKTVSEEDAQAEVKKLRDRAVSGESFESLQKLALSDLGVQGNPPPTELKKVRREGLSSATAAIFDQQLSAVSEPISEATGLYLFQMTSKRVLTVQEATPEITTSLQNQRLQQALEQISSNSKATFNPSYFGEGAKAATGPVPAAIPATPAAAKPGATPK
jgi:hypothetical protein